MSGRIFSGAGDHIRFTPLLQKYPWSNTSNRDHLDQATDHLMDTDFIHRNSSVVRTTTELIFATGPQTWNETWTTFCLQEIRAQSTLAMFHCQKSALSQLKTPTASLCLVCYSSFPLMNQVHWKLISQKNSTFEPHQLEDSHSMLVISISCITSV